MKTDTIKTYTIKPGDLVEATTALGDSALLRVEAIKPHGISVYASTDPYMCFIISPENITKITPCNPSPASIAATVACGTPPAPIQSTTSHP